MSMSMSMYTDVLRCDDTSALVIGVSDNRIRDGILRCFIWHKWFQRMSTNILVSGVCCYA